LFTVLLSSSISGSSAAVPLTRMVTVASLRLCAGSIAVAVTAPETSPRAKWVLPVTAVPLLSCEEKRCIFPK